MKQDKQKLQTLLEKLSDNSSIQRFLKINGDVVKPRKPKKEKKDKKEDFDGDEDGDWTY